jgi:transcriptional regulator with XRE-family HTH domain
LWCGIKKASIGYHGAVATTTGRHEPGEDRAGPAHGEESFVQRLRLAAELRDLRQRAGLSQHRLARELGFSQSKVLKMETGRTTAQIPDIEAWARATGVPPDEVGPLIQLGRNALTEALVVRGRRTAEPQRETVGMEKAAGTVRVYQPTLIPALLQTRAYIQSVFASGCLPVPLTEQDVLARLERQAVLFDESKTFEFIIGEAALRWRFGPAEAHLAQLDLLRVIGAFPNVQLGVLPVGFAGSVWWHHEIRLLEDFADGSSPFAEVETLTASVAVHDPGDVERYRKVFDRLREVALIGEPGRALVSEIMDQV